MSFWKFLVKTLKLFMEVYTCRWRRLLDQMRTRKTAQAVTITYSASGLNDVDAGMLQNKSFAP